MEKHWKSIMLFFPCAGHTMHCINISYGANFRNTIIKMVWSNHLWTHLDMSFQTVSELIIYKDQLLTAIGVNLKWTSCAHYKLCVWKMRGSRWCEDCVYWCKVQRSSSSLGDAGPHITSHHSFLCLLFIFMFTLLVPTKLFQSVVGFF